ncbi:alpha/beta hydrolase family protein [Chitinophaga lutea]
MQKTIWAAAAVLLLHLNASAQRTEDVQFANKADGLSLSGALSLPAGKGPFPAVIIVSGSGPQDRDGTMFGIKPYLDLANYLNGQGIAVLRYDDRGTGKSTGDYASADIGAFTRDANAALEWLRSRPEVDAMRTGLIGHSEGGAVGQVVAASDKKLAFLVSLAGPGIDGFDMMMAQIDALNKAMGFPDAMRESNLVKQRRIMEPIVQQQDAAAVKEKMTAVVREVYAETPQLKAVMPEETFVSKTIQAMTSPEYLSIIRHEPKKYYPAIQCAVLALNGSRDVQVVPAVNLQGWRDGLAANGRIETKELAGLNHLFQTCNICLPQEYATLNTSISPETLAAIAQWINGQAGPRK